jgi:hypothetical protein
MTREVMVSLRCSSHDDGMLTTALRETNEARLRLVLATNATTSGLGGLAAVVAAGTVDSALGTDSIMWVRIVGAGLVLFAALVLWTARSTTRRVVIGAPVISVGDVSWVVGTIVTIVLGWYSTVGAIVMAVVGVAVGSFGVAQAVLAGRIRSDDGTRPTDRRVLAEHVDPSPVDVRPE